MNPDQVFGLIMVGIFGVVMPVSLAIIIPVGKAWGRKIDATHRPSAIDPGVLDELHSLRERVGELEERLDFTERMLAQHREAERLPGGGG